MSEPVLPSEPTNVVPVSVRRDEASGKYWVEAGDKHSAEFETLAEALKHARMVNEVARTPRAE